MATKYWVTMTDKFMSGWGKAQGKINKYILECDSYEEALIVESNAKNRSEMKYINIRTTEPSYNSSTHLSTWKTKQTASAWYQPNSFK